MFNKSIAYRLSIYISIAVIGVFIAFMLISYFFNSQRINENIENEAIRLGNTVIRKVDTQLVTTREITSNIANQIIFYCQNDNAELLISQVMEKYKFLNAIHINIDSTVQEIPFRSYLGFRDQDTIIFEKQNEKIYHCKHEQNIIEEAIEGKEPSWTEVFNCPRSDNMIVSFYSPIQIKNNGSSKIVGEVICELSLLELNDFINNIKIGENGYSILISKDGRYLSHPNKDWIFQKSVYNLPSKVINQKKEDVEEVLEKGLSGSLIVYPESRGFEKHWIFFTGLNEIEWTLVFLFPYNELFTPLYLSILLMLFFSVLGILVIYLIITFITNRLVEPLSTVTSQLKKFSSFSENEGELNTLNEVKLVSESLNYLKSWYEKFKINQSQEEKENHRRLEDLIQASEIQRSLIKTDFSDIQDKKEIDIYAIYKPARVIGGDLFDYFFINDDQLIFTMGDVSGKGVPAAFFMSMAQTVIKNSASIKGANTIVKKVNNKLHTTNQHQFFLTLFLGILDLKTGNLEFCNAAHTPTYILKQNGEIIELSQSHGLPLGLYPNKRYLNSKITLDKGDSIILYTDGITELQNENKIQFGNERFVENLRHLVDCEPKELIERIEKSLEIFKGEAKQVDDITLMVVKYTT